MPTWVRACDVSDVDEEDVIPFHHEGRDFAVYRSPEGEFYATDGHCTHERQLLCDGLVMGRTIECPRHNGRFDYTTGAARGAPVLTGIATYPTKIEQSGVYIDVD